MAEGKISRSIVTEGYSSPGFSMAGGAVGYYDTSFSIDITKSGMRPVGVLIERMLHPGSYFITTSVSLTGSAYMLNVNIYRANTSAASYQSGEIGFMVTYI